MKVSDMIEILKDMPQDSDIHFYEDGKKWKFDRYSIINKEILLHNEWNYPE